LPETHVGAGVKAQLLKVAAIYRKHWWSKHDALNRKWIQELQPLIAKYGDGISTALTKIYEVPWPVTPVRVDVVAYGNWAGAYSTDGPTRPTICSTAPTNQGTAALEVLFHETSHGMMDKVMAALKDAEEAVNARRSHPVNFRRDLWHEVLFYTSGELVTERFPGYVPYADENGLWKRVWTGPDRALIEQDWKPHMNGAVGLEPSLKKLVEDLAASAPSSKSVVHQAMCDFECLHSLFRLVQFGRAQVMTEVDVPAQAFREHVPGISGDHIFGSAVTVLINVGHEGCADGVCQVSGFLQPLRRLYFVFGYSNSFVIGITHRENGAGPALICGLAI